MGSSSCQTRRGRALQNSPGPTMTSSWHDPTARAASRAQASSFAAGSSNPTLKVRMGALRPGTYKFFGEYHEATAKGRIVAE